MGNPLRLENVELNHVPPGKKMLGTETISALRPLESIIVPSVAMNAGSLSLATKNPFKSPKSPPMTIIMGMVSQRGIPFV